MKLPVLILLAVTTLRVAFCADPVTDAVIANPAHIDVDVTPYYFSKGPKVDTHRYSKGLASKDEKEVFATIGEMKKAWQTLDAMEMYVAAIRLYDLGYRKEGVYWFYSAQYRARLFAQVVDQEKLGGMGAPGFEHLQANDAFFQLTGPWFNGYAFGDMKWLAGVARRVQKEGATLPDLKNAYPGVAFQEQSQWTAANKEVNSGMTGLIQSLEDKDEIAAGAKARKQHGLDKAFSKLTSKDLPAQ